MSIDDEIAADRKATAETTPETRVYVDDVGYAACVKAGVERDRDGMRWAVFNWCAENGVTIYLESWPGRKSGKDFIMPADRDKVLNGLAKWFRDTDDGSGHIKDPDKFKREADERAKREAEIKAEAAEENREHDAEVDREEAAAKAESEREAAQAEQEHKREDAAMDAEHRRAAAERKRLGIDA